MTHPVTPWVLCALAALMLAVTAADMWAGAPDQIARYQ